MTGSLEPGGYTTGSNLLAPSVARIVAPPDSGAGSVPPASSKSVMTVPPAEIALPSCAGMDSIRSRKDWDRGVQRRDHLVEWRVADPTAPPSLVSSIDLYRRCLDRIQRSRIVQWNGPEQLSEGDKMKFHPRGRWRIAFPAADFL